MDRLIEKYLKEEKKIKISSIDPATMTAGKINKELDILDKKSSDLITKFIDVGRGTEKTNEIIKKTDPLSVNYKNVLDRIGELRYEIRARYGPGAPSRLPKGFKPRKK